MFKQTDTTGANEVARAKAIESISIVLNGNHTGAATMLNGFTSLEIAISPIVAFTIWTKADIFAQHALSQNRLSVERAVQSSYAETAKAIPEFISQISLTVLPSSANMDYSLASQVYIDNRQLATKSMPKIFIAIISDINFQHFLRHRINEFISMDQAFNADKDQQERNERVAALNEQVSKWSEAEKSAVKSISAALSSDDNTAEQFLNNYSDFEVTIAPVAAWTMWYEAHRKVESVMSRYDLRHPEPVEFMIEKVKKVLNDSCPEILSLVSEKIMPGPSSGENYELARTVFANNSVEAKLAMPKMIKAILSHPSFTARIKWLVEQQIGMSEMYRDAHIKADKESKFAIALKQAAAQRVKQVERSIFDLNAFAPEYQALITYFDFTLDHAEALLKDLDQTELALVPVVAKFMNNQTNVWINMLEIDSDSFNQAFYSEFLTHCCVHHDDNVRFVSNRNLAQLNVSEALLAKSKNLLATISRSEGFMEEVQTRLISRVRELKAGLSKNDTYYEEMYDVDIQTALIDAAGRALSAEAKQAVLEHAQQSIAAVTHSKQGFSFTKHPELLLIPIVPCAIGTLCMIASLLNWRAPSFTRMGHSLTTAIRSGFTFMSRGGADVVHYSPVSVEEGYSSDEHRSDDEKRPIRRF